MRFYLSIAALIIASAIDKTYVIAHPYMIMGILLSAIILDSYHPIGGE